MAVIDPQAAAQACQDIKTRLMEMPIEELRKAHQKMAIEAHNAEVERKKAEKKAAQAKRG
jgi:FtsZ-binding cell division protein ZapB